MLNVISENNVKTEFIKDFLDTCMILINKTRKEKGNIKYELLKDVKNPCLYTFVEQWMDEKSFLLHQKTEHFINAVSKIKEYLNEKPRTKVYKEIESNELIEINPEKLSLSPHEIKDKSFLITTCSNGKVNTMTANWGMIGNMWNYPTALIVIRQTRYTKKIIDNSAYFSMCFFKDNKKELGYLGTVSGSIEDKILRSGLTLDYIDGVPYFKEASEVYILEKNFDIKMEKENILDEDVIKQWYSKGIDENNYHDIYFGKIIKVFRRTI